MAAAAGQRQLQQAPADAAALPARVDIKVMDEAVRTIDRYQAEEAGIAFSNP